jgi:Family of unknown function (DUF6644)
MTPAYHFFDWLSQTYIGTQMRSGEYEFPTVEALHVMGSVVVVTATAILSLRLTGRFLREIPVSKIVSQTLPWAWSGFAVQVLTGLLLFMSEATLAYVNLLFQIKMALIVLAGILALVFHRTVYRWVERWDIGSPPFWAKFIGYTSIVIWFSVVAVGRWLNSSITNSPPLLPR